MREIEHKSNEMIVGLLEEQCTSVKSVGEFQLSPPTESMEAESTAQSQQYTAILKIQTNVQSIMLEMGEVEIIISAQIVKYIEFAEKGGQQHSSSLQRSVMSHLRSIGYDAAICKSEPKHDRGFPSGKYEFLNVLVSNTRLLVDMDFRTQFEIARPSSEYSALIQLLPLLYVGNTDRLLNTVKIMSRSAKVSLKTKAMHIPPWRTYAYMHSKWLGSYRRITNAFPEEIEECIDWKCSEVLSQKSFNERMRKLTSKMPTALMEAGLTSMFKLVPVA